MLRCGSILLILMLTSLTGTSAHAQDDVWTITERCFGEAAPPPDDWTFSGTLLMTSPGRLHAYQQGWDTPHIAVYDAAIPYHSALSPDGRWYAVVQEAKDNSLSSMVVSWYRVRAINVYSTRTDEKYVIPWESLYGFSQQPIGHQLYWLDNERLLSSESKDEADTENWFSINPFSGAVEPWNAPLNPAAFRFILAPDGSSALSDRNGDVDDWLLDTGENELQLPLLSVIAWQPDSSSFAAYTRRGFNADEVARFAADGSRLDTLFTIPHGTPTRILSGRLWSADGTQLLFTADKLYLADMETEQVFDLCVDAQPIRSVVWSPDGTQFALITNQPNDGVQIFDLQTWERYVVAHHNGDLIGWRADE